MKGRFISISFLCLALFNTATYAQIQWRYFPAQLSVARSFFQALPISSSRVLVIGGYSNSGQPTNTCEIIDFDRLTVEPAAPMNEPRAEFIALLTVDSNVVVIGGKTTNGTSATVELYNRSLNTWSIIGMLNIARFQHAALCLNDHQILIVGGRLLDLSTTARAEIFDLNTGTAQMIPDYPWAMCYLRGATTSSGDHLVWGGRSGGPNSFRSNIVYAYVPQPSPSWQMYGRLAEPVYAPTVLTLQDGRILISGGAFEEAPASSFLQSTRVYLHENSSINLVGSLSMGRVWHQMVQWNTDSALIIGGQIDGIGFVATPTCEWFDLKQLSAHQAPQMNEERAFFAAVKLSPNPSRYIIAAIAGTRSTNRNTPTIEVLMNGCITEPLTITGPTTLLRRRHRHTLGFRRLCSIPVVNRSELAAHLGLQARYVLGHRNRFRRMLNLRLHHHLPDSFGAHQTSEQSPSISSNRNTPLRYHRGHQPLLRYTLARRHRACP